MLKTLIKAKIIPKITEMAISDRPLLPNEYDGHVISPHRWIARGLKFSATEVRRLGARRKAVEFEEY